MNRIPKGAKLEDPPVEQPTKFEFVINLDQEQRISDVGLRIGWRR
jgi:hypothetical protein